MGLADSPLSSALRPNLASLSTLHCVWAKRKNTSTSYMEGGLWVSGPHFGSLRIQWYLPAPPAPVSNGSLLLGPELSRGQVLNSGIPSGLSGRASSTQQWYQSGML